MVWAKYMKILKSKIIFSFFLTLFIIGIAYYLNGKFFQRHYKLSCRLGDRKYYDVSYISTGSSDLTLFQSTKQAFKVEFKGKVKETCLEDKDESIFIQYDFKNAHTFVRNQEITQHLKDSHINTNLVLVDISKNGVINEIYFSKYIDPTISNIYREYIANSFVNFTNKENNKNEWENSIQNFAGISQYVYTILNARVTRNFVDGDGQNQSFLYDDAKNIKKYYSNDSQTFYSLAANNIPFSIRMKRYLNLFLNNKQIGFEETTFYKKLQETKNTDLASIQNKVNSLKGSEFYKTDLLAKDVEERLKEKILLQNFKYTQFTDFLRQADLEKKENYTEYFLQLKSLFSLEPKSTSDAIPYLAKLNQMSDEFSLVISALVNANNIESQQAMIQTYYLLTDKKAKMVLLANLATSESPAIETETFARSFLSINDRDIRNTAVLALGNIARNLNGKDNNRKNNVFNDLTNEVNSAQDPHAKSVALLALGNAADERALDNIKANLSAQNEDVRKSAAFALRFINRSEPDQALNNILLYDKSEAVKLSALEAIAYRNQGQEIIETQKKILRSDVSEKIRMQALKNLAQAGEKEEVKYAMTNDLSKSVRTYAENLLTRFENNL